MFKENILKRPNISLKASKVLELISRDRTRTNLLRKYEQKALVFLVQRIPSRISSNMMTAFGFFGSIVVFTSFLLATYIHRSYLLLGVLGLTINWFGDSLDGRLAYYRNKPRKLYGFAFDITMDWLSIILVGCGYIFYSSGFRELLGYGFVVMYGWEMIIVLLRYKITGHYKIDSGKIGPTEVRIVIAAVLIAEVLLPGSILYTAIGLAAILLIFNIMDTRKLLKIADKLDIEERKHKSNEEIH